MQDKFRGITKEEYEALKHSISLITALIAGADGNIDTKEKEWAAKVTEIRSYSLPPGLRDFYLEVDKDFEERLDATIEKYAGETETRNRLISERLALLNPIMAKIEDRELAVAFYESLISFARHVARASGGFLSWGSINVQERRLLSLDMIDPVEE